MSWASSIRKYQLGLGNPFESLWHILMGLDEELREFTSEYYIPSALHPEVPAASASIADFPEGKGSLPRDERPPPGSYSMEDAELIMRNRITFNAFSEAFLCHLEMDLFSVVHLSKPKLVTEGVRPLRDGEEPLVPGGTVEPPGQDATSVGSSEDADVAEVKGEAGEVDSGLKRKRATSDDGRLVKEGGHVSLGLSSLEWRTLDAPNHACSHGGERDTPPISGGALLHSSQPRNGSKAFVGYASGSAFGGSLILVTAQSESRTESSRSYAQNLAKEKMALLVKVEQEHADAANYKASCHWAVKYLEGGKNNHFTGLDEFRQRVEGLLEKQEEKLRKLSIEYDEELYPHMLSAIAERRWLISHGLRLAAMSTLESQRLSMSLGML
ncbi:hypothetical protein Tco_1005716 [Tanacetum coccineum]|uniref:Uncharacterized protein n=1 Tax=Tanacetum coccineum TaxID=301880 RepID=A0ABQ5FGK6_9ASTR